MHPSNSTKVIHFFWKLLTSVGQYELNETNGQKHGAS